MDVFLSWSGDVSRGVAEVVYEICQDLNLGVTPWMSGPDVDAGSRWRVDLGQALDSADAGIFFLTEEAQKSPWVLFEAGVLFRKTENMRLIPVLIGLDRAQLVGPLAELQHFQGTFSEIVRMVQQLSMAASSECMPTDRIPERMEVFRDRLERALSAPQSNVEDLDTPSIESIHAGQEKVLGVIIELSRRLSSIEEALAPELAEPRRRGRWAAMLEKYVQRVARQRDPTRWPEIVAKVRTLLEDHPELMMSSKGQLELAASFVDIVTSDSRRAPPPTELDCDP